MRSRGVRTDHPREAEVAQLDYAVGRQQDVLGLDVAVDAVVPVAVRHAL